MANVGHRVTVGVSHALPHDAPTAVPVEGARIGLTTCRVCGAALLLDPREDVSPLDVHYIWHRAKGEVL
jgi:hypothetical protein